MKKIVCSIIITVVIMFAIGVAMFQHIYPRAMVVTSISRDADIVYVTDVNGEEWGFFGAEDWSCGDVCAIIFFDNFTESIYDDIIIRVRYSGHL